MTGMYRYPPSCMAFILVNLNAVATFKQRTDDLL